MQLNDMVTTPLTCICRITYIYVQLLGGEAGSQSSHRKTSQFTKQQQIINELQILKKYTLAQK